MGRAASTKGALYEFPWQPLGHWKYGMFLGVVALGYYEHAHHGVHWAQNIGLHLLLLSALRYVLFQLWGTAARLPAVSRKHQIVKKGIAFEQIEHEASWENTVLLSLPMFAAAWSAFRADFAPQLRTWDARGVALAFALHVGPVEWLYYWAHRALHHHYLFTRYHTHHHSSFVTQPITSTNHPLLESLFYNALFAVPVTASFAAGCGSIALAYIYVLFIDFMDAWGHCNFEFIPAKLFRVFPPLKYIVYSPTFHSLHHTKVHTNFSLFMPLYDYLYNTLDPVSDDLHRRVRLQGEQQLPVAPDCVYLTHATHFLAFFHLPFGFQTWAAKPFRPDRCCLAWATLPLSLPLVLLLWIFAKPFAIATHFLTCKSSSSSSSSFELQTWFIPRFKFQYKIGFEKPRIQRWVEDCILEAQAMGVKVIALGLLNKAQISPDFLGNEIVSIAIVNGDTLSAAIVAKKIEAQMAANRSPHSAVFVAQAETRVGRGIAKYLCEHGTQVLAMLPSQGHYDSLRSRIEPNSQRNLTYAMSYEDGKESAIWVVGEEIGAEEQSWAPAKTRFHTFGPFALLRCRRDCIYELVPSLGLPDDAKTINVCEDILPRNVVRACYAAGMIHSLEGWKHNDLNDEISTYLVEQTWDSAIKHGFTLPSD